MKKFFGGLIFFVLLMAVTRNSNANLVPNGDFKELKAGNLGDWKVGEVNPPQPLPEKGDVDGSKGVMVRLDRGETGDGSYSIKLSAAGTGKDYGLVFSPRFPLVPGFEYEMTVRYRAEGLLQENGDRSKYSALIVDLFMEKESGHVGGTRIITSANSPVWVTLNRLTNYTNRFRALPGTEQGQIRVQLTNLYDKAPMSAWVDNVTVEPLDPTLTNGSMETGSEARPERWTPYGSAKSQWDGQVAHTGKYSVSVSDAPDGLFSGWSMIIPVRADREYAFTGYIKGGLLNPNGMIGGGALELQFLDSFGQPLGNAQVSRAVGAHTDWAQVTTPVAKPPVGATTARLTAGMRYTNGTAWFDDLSLIVNVSTSKEIKRVKLQHSGTAVGVKYADNLLSNGNVEAGEGNKPAGWTYVGESSPNWSKAEVEEFHAKGRAKFEVGRGQGEWSRDTVYEGKGALLNISIDPPLSPTNQWHGRNPVDGYWLSDAVPCQSGVAYMASAWLKPGKPIEESWLGPLEIRFYDGQGRQLPMARDVRTGIGTVAAGVWSYYATLPYVAPTGAKMMRLRFGQELAADKGGWGRTFGDNFAVWEVPSQVAHPVNDQAMCNNTSLFRDWFRKMSETIKPPYLPAPSDAPAYESVWGRWMNVVPGNIYTDPAASVAAHMSLTNLLGEDRSVTLQIVRYDALGNAEKPIIVKDVLLKGASTNDVSVTLPPVGKYGAFYLDANIYDGDAVVGMASGRYAELPSSEAISESIRTQGGWKLGAEIRKWFSGSSAIQKTAPDKSVENNLGVTILTPISGDGRPFETELGKMLQTGGFGLAWVRFFYEPNEESLQKQLAVVKKQIAWYRSLGIRCIVQLNPRVVSPVDPAAYEAAGRIIGKALNGEVAAIGNWGIEQANSTSPYRDGGWTDKEYDPILAAQYDGIKSVAPNLTVLIGNIATDFEANTVRRLYGSPANGKFDGGIINAYMGQLSVTKNMLKEFDAHGDKSKTVWSEEQANQRSPYEGEARRYGEVEGARELVRSWMSMLGQFGTRLKAVTMWGFVNGVDEDIMMVTPTLQPRPQFVAHAIMADFLRGAVLIGDRSTANVTLYEWKRSEGSFMVAWANAGERDLALDVPSGQLTITDILGNSRVEKANDGVVTLKLTTSPVYLSGGGDVAISKKLEARLTRGDTRVGEPAIRLTVKNNAKDAIEGVVQWNGEIADTSSASLALKPGEERTLIRLVKSGLSEDKRTPFSVGIRLKGGAVYGASASLNFAQASRTIRPPAMDGTWQGWENAPVIGFGKDSGEMSREHFPPDVSYGGTSDILGNIRMMWDEKFLYLGVEAQDDIHVACPERGKRGFMGDSIEFGVQANGILSESAPYSEFEMYLPTDGTARPMINRRLPLPAGEVTGWLSAIRLTGHRGDANYQVAIPWKDLGVGGVETGRTFTMALVLNDADRADRLRGDRKRIVWFHGVDGAKSPTGFGDVTLVSNLTSHP